MIFYFKFRFFSDTLQPVCSGRFCATKCIYFRQYSLYPNSINYRFRVKCRTEVFTISKFNINRFGCTDYRIWVKDINIQIVWTLLYWVLNHNFVKFDLKLKSEWIYEISDEYYLFACLSDTKFFSNPLESFRIIQSRI